MKSLEELMETREELIANMRQLEIYIYQLELAGSIFWLWILRLVYRVERRTEQGMTRLINELRGRNQ